MKLRIGLVAVLALVAALALGPTILVVGDGRQRRRALERDRRGGDLGAGATPSDASSARGERRAGGDGARRRCTTPSSRSKEAWSRSRPASSAPPSASVDAAVAQAARDVLVVTRAGTGGSRPDAPTTRTWRRSRPEPRRTAARRSAQPPRRGCSPPVWATVSTTSSRTCSRRLGRACSSRSPPASINPVPPPKPVSVELGRRAPVHVRHARLPARRPRTR